MRAAVTAVADAQARGAVDAMWSPAELLGLLPALVHPQRAARR